MAPLEVMKRMLIVHVFHHVTYIPGGRKLINSCEALPIPLQLTALTATLSVASVTL